MSLVSEMNERLDCVRAQRRLIGLDAGIVRGSWLRALRRWLVGVALVAGTVELYGVPHLRTSWRADQQLNIYSARYWSVTGVRVLHSGGAAPNCPLIVLVPLERPLWSYAWASIRQEE